MDFENKSNKELKELLEEMSITHSNIRARMLHDFTNLERVEKDYEKVKRILAKRLR
jgi:hypothetical protein